MHINVNDHSFPISPPSPIFILDESLGWLLTASGWPARMGCGGRGMITGTCEGLGLRSDPRRSLSPSLGEVCFFALWAVSLPAEGKRTTAPFEFRPPSGPSVSRSSLGDVLSQCIRWSRAALWAD